MVTKQIKHKQEDGKEVILDIGAKAVNVETDNDHQFVTTAEKEEIGKSSEAAQSASNKIGTTEDIGGSASTGTVMAKLNKIISDLITHMGRWNAVRASYIDAINTNTVSTKTIADSIKKDTDRIGTTGDTGGSTSAGTVMGKLNKLLTDLLAHVKIWNSTRAGYIDTIKTSTDKMGTKGDTGGSATEGTVFGKLNALISNLITHMESWTITRAGYIDIINTSTKTNNTASETGNLSQKMSHIINLIKNKGTVKSVQRGVTTLQNSLNGAAQVSISSVNPSKCLVILDGSIQPSAITDMAYTPYVYALAATQLTIKANDETMTTAQPVLDKAKISWQIVEFY